MFISKAQLQAIQFASPDPARSGLYGLYITKTEVAATDGHRLMVVEHGKPPKLDANLKLEGRTEPTLPGILYRESIEAVLKAWPKVKKSEKQEFHDWAWLSKNFLSVIDAQCKRIDFPIGWADGKFPNYKQIVPKDSERPFRIGLSARFLAEAVYLTDAKSKMLDIHLLDKNHSALIVGKNQQGQSCKHVIMAMNVS